MLTARWKEPDDISKRGGIASSHRLSRHLSLLSCLPARPSYFLTFIPSLLLDSFADTNMSLTAHCVLCECPSGFKSSLTDGQSVVGCKRDAIHPACSVAGDRILPHACYLMSSPVYNALVYTLHKDVESLMYPNCKTSPALSMLISWSHARIS